MPRNPIKKSYSSKSTNSLKSLLKQWCMDHHCDGLFDIVFSHFQSLQSTDSASLSIGLAEKARVFLLACLFIQLQSRHYPVTIKSIAAQHSVNLYLLGKTIKMIRNASSSIHHQEAPATFIPSSVQFIIENNLVTQVSPKTLINQAQSMLNSINDPQSFHQQPDVIAMSILSILISFHNKSSNHRLLASHIHIAQSTLKSVVHNLLKFIHEHRFRRVSFLNDIKFHQMHDYALDHFHALFP